MDGSNTVLVGTASDVVTAPTSSSGREEEMNNMVKTLKMFEFGSWEDATSRTSKMPTTTRW